MTAATPHVFRCVGRTVVVQASSLHGLPVMGPRAGGLYHKRQAGCLHHKSVLAFVPALILAAAGCGTARPIDAWQKEFGQYLSRHGNDPSVLRDAAALRSPRSQRPAMVQFSETDIRGRGIPPFVSRNDVHGVFLGQGGKGSTPTMIFLVGVVRRPLGGPSQVDDIRLAAYQMRRDHDVWKVSEADPEALQRYLASDDARLPRPSDHRAFPALDDSFRLELKDGYAVATDENSGAVWRLTLATELQAGR